MGTPFPAPPAPRERPAPHRVGSWPPLSVSSPQREPRPTPQSPPGPRSPPAHPSPAGPRALRLSPLGERVPAPPTEPGTPSPSRAPAGPPPLSPRRGLAGRAGPGARARAGAFGIGCAATAPAPEPCPSEAPARASCQSAARARPPAPSPDCAGAVRPGSGVTGWGGAAVCARRSEALGPLRSRLAAGSGRLSDAGVLPRPWEHSWGPLTEGRRNDVSWICSKH